MTSGSPGGFAGRITLLGPQRRPAGSRAALAELMPPGPVATVNAGWQEREGDTGELDEVLGGRMLNLELFRRWRQLSQVDVRYAGAERELSRSLEELRTGYRIRLHHALAAVRAVGERMRDHRLRTAALDDAVWVVQELDAWHLAQSAALREGFAAAVSGRDSLDTQRGDLRSMLERSAGLVLAGGHVGVLRHLLAVFGVDGPPPGPVIAWSAGAMVLTERIVLFHDRAADGPRDPEVYAPGLGLVPGLVAFPHARQRLRLEESADRRLLARRLAPRRALLLDEGCRLDLAPGGDGTGQARLLDEDGAVVEVGAT